MGVLVGEEQEEEPKTLADYDPELVAMVANMFLQIPALGLAISSMVIVVFSLFLLHDLSRIVTGGETNYLMATTGVYMSLFNIFSSLLQLLLALTGEKD